MRVPVQMRLDGELLARLDRVAAGPPRVTRTAIVEAAVEMWLKCIAPERPTSVVGTREEKE